MNREDHEDMALTAYIVERWDIFETISEDDMPAVREAVRQSFGFRAHLLQSSVALLKAEASPSTLRAKRELRKRPRNGVALFRDFDEGPVDSNGFSDAAGDVDESHVRLSDEIPFGARDGDDDALRHDDEGTAS